MNKFLLSFLILICFLFSCQYLKKSNLGKPLAKVHDTYLYFNDMLPYLPDDLTGNDSTFYVENYINDWVVKQLILHNAINYLSDEEKYIAHQMEAFRSSLLIHKYKQKVLNNQFSTYVTEKECRDYYITYANNFVANKTIVKATCLKFTKKGFSFWKVRLLMNKVPDKESISSLKKMIKNTSNNFRLYFYQWEDFDKFHDSFPNFSTYKNTILRRKYFVIRKNNHYFAIKIHRIIKPGNMIPLDLKKEENDIFSTPKNLGNNINSSTDELGFVVTIDGEIAYFSTSLKNDTDKDIYRLKVPMIFKPAPTTLYRKGKILNQYSKVPVFAQFTLINKNNKRDIQNYFSDIKTGEYIICMNKGNEYLLYVSADGFMYYAESFDTRDKIGRAHV